MVIILNRAKRNGAKIYGILIDHENISFVLDGFQCVLINANMEVKEKKTISVKQGFILGRTTEGKFIYIYAGKDISIRRQATINTWLYFISRTPDVETYRAISFNGGILNKLFFNAALDFDYDKSGHIKVQYKDDQQVYSLVNEEMRGTVAVRSSVSENVSAEKGTSIAISGTELELVFEEEQKVETFSDMFGYILNLCQFMAYRRNVRFEEIFLGQESKRLPGIYEKIASCFVRYDEKIETEKNMHMCITFNELGEGTAHLLNSIMNNRTAKPQFMIGFLPENDEDVNLVTSMKIREICSSLESEMELLDIRGEHEKEFEELIDKLKKVVKEHRDGDGSLDKKDYDYVFGTLNHLTGALGDRIENCFMEYQPILGEVIYRKQIDQIVKYRNTITHGNYMQLDVELAETAYVLIMLIYCCILKRVGMADDRIHELFLRRIIS